MLKNIAHLTHHVRLQQQVTAEPDSAQETRSAGVLILAFAVSRTESYRLLLLTRSRASCWSSVNELENKRGRERGVHMSWGCSTAQLPLSSQGYWALQGFSSDFYVLELMKPPDPPPPFSFFPPALSLSWSCRAFSISLEGTSVLTSSGTLAPLPICLGRPNCQYPCACLVWLCKLRYLLNPGSCSLPGFSASYSVTRVKRWGEQGALQKSGPLIPGSCSSSAYPCENVGLLQAALFFCSSGR